MPSGPTPCRPRSRAATLVPAFLAVGLLAACTGGSDSAITPTIASAGVSATRSVAGEPTRGDRATEGDPWRSTSTDAASHGAALSAATIAENAQPGSASWQVASVAEIDQLAGYTDVASIAAGDSFRLMARSALGKVTVTAYRMGWYAGAGARQVWQSDPLDAPTQPPPSVERINGSPLVSAGWKPLLTVPSQEWPAGSYLLVLQGGGKGRYVPMTIRPASLAGALVVVNPTATWEAYNTWGAGSLYEGGGGADVPSRVSFDRPNTDNASHFLLDALPYLQRAEKLGMPAAYVTSADLELPGVLAGTAGVASVGHDEYWTVPMRRAVEAARDAGSNLAFLGGNAMFWRVRFERQGRVLVGFKARAAQDPVRGATTTAKWREDPTPDPENSVLGLLYECYPASGAFTIYTPDFFLYAGTGVTRDTSFPGLVGVESDRAYPIAGTPDSLQVVAHSTITCGSGRTTTHDAVYYTASSGAGVFSIGTIQWANAVGGTAVNAAGVAFARQVTDTLFQAMVAGPMGRAHPSVPNLASIKANPATSTGTGGPLSKAWATPSSTLSPSSTSSSTPSSSPLKSPSSSPLKAPSSSPARSLSPPPTRSAAPAA
ncbi:MAG TPA: hypothetical protein PKA99_07615 [Dermatophilaceae bacterium]|nr:hypothetical protein [Dermatophilaceae bacterium]